MWESMEEDIRKIISAPTIESVTIAGYSHGGALAVLCHEYIWSHRPDLRKGLLSFGFGAPRVIWMPKRELLPRWESFTLVRNPDDAVTHLPPAIFGYTHLGKKLEISKKGSYSPIGAHREENILRELRRIYT